MGPKEILAVGREFLEAIMVIDTIMARKRNVRGVNQQEEGDWKGVLRTWLRGRRICCDLKG